MRHVLAEPQEDHGGLRTGSFPAGNQSSAGFAADKLLGNRPPHGLQSIVTDAVMIGITTQIAAGTGVITLELGIAEQNCRQLLASNPGQRRSGKPSR